MAQEPKCNQCGSDDLVGGTLNSSGLVRFRPKGVNFFSFRTADITVNTRICMVCGSISLEGDIEKLKLLRRQPIGATPGESS